MIKPSGITTTWTAFADGASSGNPGPGGWGVVLIHTPTGRVFELGGSETHTTNNRMELTGAVEALRFILGENHQAPDPSVNARVLTDSTYVIQGITKWIYNWKMIGWKTAEGKDVLNRDLWEKLESEIQKFPSRLEWDHVAGHAGIPGNERVDAIAVAFSKKQSPALFRGKLVDYSVPNILEIKKPTPTKGGPAYYLSLVGNSLARHSTWAECEARVKGQSGARFKKVQSSEEEKAVLKSWGVSN